MYVSIDVHLAISTDDLAGIRADARRPRRCDVIQAYIIATLGEPKELQPAR